MVIESGENEKWLEVERMRGWRMDGNRCTPGGGANYYLPYLATCTSIIMLARACFCRPVPILPPLAFLALLGHVIHAHCAYSHCPLPSGNEAAAPGASELRPVCSPVTESQGAVAVWAVACMSHKRQ